MCGRTTTFIAQMHHGAVLNVGNMHTACLLFRTLVFSMRRYLCLVRGSGAVWYVMEVTAGHLCSNLNISR